MRLVTRILVLIPSLDIGGAELDLVRTLPLIDRGRFMVEVGVLEAHGPLSAALREAGIPVHGPFAAKARSKPGGIASGCKWIRLLAIGIRYLRSSRRIAQGLRDGRFDLLHTMSPSAFVAGALALGWPKRRRLLMSRVTTDFYRRNAKAFGVVERVLSRRIDLATGNAQAILRELADDGIPERKLKLVRNGIDAAAFARSMTSRAEARQRLGVPADALVFTAVANLYDYKGYPDLLAALELLKERLAGPWCLLAAGRDVAGNLAAFRRLAAAHGLDGRVQFLGPRLDVPVILSAADIHVSASHHEGFPNNITEAMCAALPVVATAVGGVPEQVVAGSTGLLVPPHQPAALADALLTLARDPARRVAFGRAGCERASDLFSLQGFVRGLEEAYGIAARS